MKKRKKCYGTTNNFMNKIENNKTESLFPENPEIEQIDGLPIRDFDKVDLILLLAGDKTAVDINVSSDNNEWQNTIRDLGLYLVESKELGDENKRKFYIARTKEDAEKLLDAFTKKNDVNLGILSGYPSSAIENYSWTMNQLRNSNLEENEVIALLRERYAELEDLPPEADMKEISPFIHFRLSSQNWKQEIEVVRNWVAKIKELDPMLYERIQKYYK